MQVKRSQSERYLFSRSKLFFHLNRNFMTLELSPYQIDIAQQLFIATAFRDVVKADFEKMEQAIIDEGIYHIDDIYYTKEFEAMRESYPHDRIITNPGQTMFLAGLKLIDTPDYKNTDAQVYFSLLRSQALQKGYIWGENTFSEADNEVVQLEVQLITETQNIHGIQPRNIIHLQDRKELIKVLLSILAPVLQRKEMESKIDDFFSMRLLSNS